MKIKFIFAWYDLWVGVFIDTLKSRLFIFPIPMFGLVIDWSGVETECVSREYHVDACKECSNYMVYTNSDGANICDCCGATQ